MINKISITGIKFEIDDTTRKYVTKKVTRLGRYLPRHARKSAMAEVILQEVNRPHGNKYEAEVVIHVPHKTLTAKDSTVNILAAFDIVEAKLVSQLHRYKMESIEHLGRRRSLLSKIRRGYQPKTSEI